MGGWLSAGITRDVRMLSASTVGVCVCGPVWRKPCFHKEDKDLIDACACAHYVCVLTRLQA